MPLIENVKQYTLSDLRWLAAQDVTPEAKEMLQDEIKRREASITARRRAGGEVMKCLICHEEWDEVEDAVLCCDDAPQVKRPYDTDVTREEAQLAERQQTARDLAATLDAAHIEIDALTKIVERLRDEHESADAARAEAEACCKEGK